MFLIETQCCPPISAIQSMIEQPLVTIEQHENYQKRSYRNRFYLNSAQGKILFTIPLTKGKNEKQSIQNVLISYQDDWIDLLTKVLRTNYGSAPYFEFYFDSFLEIAKRHYPTLLELNQAWLSWLLAKIGSDLKIELSNEYVSHKEHLIGDFRNKFRPHLPNPSSKKYVQYAQLYEERNTFISDLSILDMIFCCGPETLSVIKNSQY